MLFPLRVIRRIHREGFRCIPEAIRFRIALHRQRPFLQTETALRQAEEDGYQAFIRRHEAPLSAHFTPTMRLSFLIPTYNTPPELLRALADCNATGMMLYPKPGKLRTLFDDDYIMASLGVLSRHYPDAALALMKHSFGI